MLLYRLLTLKRADNGRSARLFACANILIYCGRFHGVADNPYILPNDEEEWKRLSDIQLVITELYGKNLLAPIVQAPQLILDAGTGSGTSPLVRCPLR